VYVRALAGKRAAQFPGRQTSQLATARGAATPPGRGAMGDRIGRAAAGSVTDCISCSARSQVGRIRIGCLR
jgi:hypothetical protein